MINSERPPTSSGRRPVASMPLAALLGAFLLSVQSGWADAIIFRDLTDQITVEGAPTRVSVGSGPGCPEQGFPFPPLEGCQVILSAPPGQTLALDAFGNVDLSKSTIFTAQGEIAESDGTISDEWNVVEEPSAAGVQLQFVSGIEGSPPCVIFGLPCQITEDGTVQTLGTVAYSDGTVDTIQFQSGESAVPEPSSIFLSLAVFAVLGISRHRRSCRQS
jgi:hypothetical protein